SLPAQIVRKGYVVASGDANQNACATQRSAYWPIAGTRRYPKLAYQLDLVRFGDEWDHCGLEGSVLQPSADERCKPNVGGHARDTPRKCALRLGHGATGHPPDDPSSKNRFRACQKVWG